MLTLIPYYIIIIKTGARHRGRTCLSLRTSMTVSLKALFFDQISIPNKTETSTL
jgi:hypothetical protein